MKTDIYSIFWIMKAAVPHLGPGASIINTTSIQAYEPSGNVFDYAITKAGIANFTKGLSQPLMEKHGIRIKAVAPGPIWTPLQEADGDEKKLEKLGENTPYKRPGQQIDLAPVYVLLASQEASYIMGEIYESKVVWESPRSLLKKVHSSSDCPLLSSYGVCVETSGCRVGCSAM